MVTVVLIVYDKSPEIIVTENKTHMAANYKSWLGISSWAVADSLPSCQETMVFIASRPGH